MAKMKKRKKKRSRSAVTKTVGSKTIKTKMTKSQLIAYLVSYVESQEEEITSDITSKDMRKLVTAVMGGLADAIDKSIRPGSAGEFMMPRMFKITLRTKKAIKKGTMVRSPASGEMVASKGRPARKQVRMRPLINLKRAAAGE